MTVDYRAVLADASVAHARFIRIVARGDHNAWIVLLHDRLDFGAGDSALLSSLAPHFALALTMLMELRSLRLRATIAEDALALIGVGQAIFDSDGQVIIADEIATEFARAEGAAFVSGSGVNQPLGFLSSPTSAAVDSARPMGTLQTIGTGVAGGFAVEDPEDVLIDLVQSLRSPYRQGAAFVMNSATAAEIRKFRTADGAFMFQPSLAAGQPATLLGYPLIEAEDMPDIGAGSLSIAFGNFKAGYVIAERNSTTILRDPYTHKPYVHFYATKRVGGQIMNSEAIKLLQFA